MTVIFDEDSIPNLVKTIRKKAGLSQLELAELAGVGKTLVFNIENGQVNVQFENLLKILRVLNIKVHAETPE